MKSITQKTLGLQVVIKGVPSTAAEFDEQAGEVGACLNGAVDDNIYRSWLPKFKDPLCKKLEETFGIPRLTEGEGDDEKIVERETQYIKRLTEVEGKTLAEINVIAQEVADTLPFNVSATSGGRIAKAYFDAADAIIARVANDYDGDYTRFIENITAANPGYQFAYDEAGEPTREAIALAIKVNKERQEREAMAGLLA